MAKLKATLEARNGSEFSVRIGRPGDGVISTALHNLFDAMNYEPRVDLFEVKLTYVYKDGSGSYTHTIRRKSDGDGS